MWGLSPADTFRVERFKQGEARLVNSLGVGGSFCCVGALDGISEFDSTSILGLLLILIVW